MRFSPLSFVLGLAAASLVPMLSRVFRPLAVEMAAAGMGMVEDARRILAEQVETVEDIVAEARARREQLDADAMAAAAAAAAEASENGAEAARDTETVSRPRRRANGARRRVS